MNYSKAFSFVFEDKDWLSKILIAGLIALIPVVGQIYLLGWAIEIIRRYKAGRRDILPATHFGAFLTTGLKMIVIGLIYSIPILVLGFILNIFTGISTGSDNGAIQFIFGSLSCFGGLLTFLLNLAMILASIYGMMKLAETDEIKACLDFGDLYNCIRSNLSTFVVVALLIFVAELIESAGIIICIGIIFTIPYGTAISAHLVGQLWDTLKPYDSTEKPFRGSVKTNTDDVIEEAPFTKVSDIEKTATGKTEIDEIDVTPEEIAEDAAEAAKEIAEETTEAVEEIAEAAEDVLEEAPAEEPAQEWDQTPADFTESEENGETPADEPTEEKPADDNNDLPSFE